MPDRRSNARTSATADANRHMANLLGTFIDKSAVLPNASPSANRQLGNYLGRLNEGLKLDRSLESLAGISKEMRPFGALYEALGSERLSEMASRGLQIAEEIKRPVIRNDVVRFPPNPLHETNRLLKDLGADIQMLVSIQAKQGEVVNTLFATIAEASLASQRAARSNTRFVLIGLGLSLLAIFLGA